MWIVRVALRRPYTFIVVAILVLILGTLSILSMPTDIFPNINIPVLSIIWTYSGLPADDMANRITTPFERAMTTDIDGIEHIESQSLNGVAVVKVFFHPGTDINRAMAEAAANAQSILKILPPGILPPQILAYSASTVPVLQLALSSKTLSEQELYDLGSNFIRTRLATIQGAGVPLPFGGKVRTIMVDLDTEALQARGLSPLDVVNAVNAQNLILPGGTAKMGAFEYNVNLNGSPLSVAALNDLPIKAVPGGVIHLHDVAQVRDGFVPQTNIVRVNGGRSALLEIEKTGNASTLAIVSQVEALLPQIAAGLPRALRIDPVSDQSVFVRAAVGGVVREGLIAAALTGLMILLFLGNWRATLIIAVSIPLAILTSLTALYALGETINIMTLGGLALAVGILVDDATVAIENISHHLEAGQPPEQAILEASEQIAVPTLVSTLCICIVFVPMFLLSGVARYLFVPLGEAVVFAMLASYFFSRTLIPTLAMYLLRARGGYAQAANVFARLQRRFESGFERLRERYQDLLGAVLRRPRRTLVIMLGFCAVSLLLAPVLGQDFFPSVDTGEIHLHVRARTGTRIEQTARIVSEIERRIHTVIPRSQLAGVIDNIGLPVSGINLTYDSSDPIGDSDADILVTLTANHAPTVQYARRLRAVLNQAFPGVSFSFLPADIVSEILNFGLPSPVDVQVVGNDLTADRTVARRLMARLRSVEGLVDLQIHQPDDAPAINVDVDRAKAIEAGFQQREVAQDLLIALSGSAQTAPSFWLNPKNGVSYPLVTEAPQYDIDSLQALRDIPLAGGSAIGAPSGAGAPTAARSQILGSLGAVRRAEQDGAVSHYDVQPVIDIFGTVQGRDLGGVARDMDRIIAASRKDLPRGTSIVVRGQVQTMRSSFDGLFAGIAFAIVLAYLLMVINFQSWVDPLIIISGLPGALAGIVWILFATDTPVSVPALTGTIMCLGVATANSILVVTFARDVLARGNDPARAALEAGIGRFRPVLMTALAMLIGMLPMALGLGDGGEENAPLGRAVFGGLLVATAFTLLFVPAAFSAVHGWLQKRARLRGDTLPIGSQI
ncbi:MAG: efflux RND transporter permease subunit [Gammaproteobacteria bacterium]|nr:efflux RND transporter permease subunit [Gammaproteobacteria bacterium]